jgi:hypothetical protein
MVLTGETEVLREKHVSVPLCLQEVSSVNFSGFPEVMLLRI